MLNPKQACYINLGLKDSYKGIYYWHGKEVNVVHIDSIKLKTTAIHGIKFKNDEKAKYFAENYITYDEYYFDVFAYREDVIIEPKRIDGQLQIDCGKNEEMAKKLVKRLRTQYIERLNRNKQNERSDKKDFKGMKF